jgi:hypothetical protein
VLRQRGNARVGPRQKLVTHDVTCLVSPLVRGRI